MADRTRLLLLGLAVMCALLFTGAVVIRVIGNNSDTAISAKSLARQIQRERVRNIRDACEAQNERHDGILRTVDELIAKSPPSRRAQAEANRANTVLFVNALAPRRDCDAVVAKQAPGGGKP